jgi:hypothetical protein
MKRKNLTNEAILVRGPWSFDAGLKGLALLADSCYHSLTSWEIGLKNHAMERRPADRYPECRHFWYPCRRVVSVARRHEIASEEEKRPWWGRFDRFE